MASSKIPFFLVALCTLGGSQIPLSKGMEVKGLGNRLADNHPKTLSSELGKNLPVPGLHGNVNLRVRKQEGNNAELVPANHDIISRSKNKEIDHRINALKLDHALRAVAVHLDELRNYIKPIEENVGAAAREPESLAESPFENYSTLSETLSHGLSKKMIKTNVVPIWKHLQAEFIKQRCKSQENPEIQLKYLKSLFLLGDYIHSNGLLTNREIGNIEIFNPTTVVKLVELHVDCLITSKGKNLFDSAEWVNPPIDLLISNPSLKHFHRSMKDLPDEHKKYLEYLTLRIILENYKELHPDKNPDTHFTPHDLQFFQGYLRKKFFKNEDNNFFMSQDGAINLKDDQFISKLSSIMNSVNNEMKYLHEWKQNKTTRFKLSVAYYIMHYTEFVDTPSLQLPLVPYVYYDYLSLSKSGFDTIGNLLKESQNSFQCTKKSPAKEDTNIFGLIKSFGKFFTDSKIPNFSEKEFKHKPSR